MTLHIYVTAKLLLVQNKVHNINKEVEKHLD